MTASRIRPAKPDELPRLNDLTRRSVLHWGYELEFLDWEPEAIILTAHAIANDPVFVLEIEDMIIGYYQLSGEVAHLVLDKLFVEPDSIGTGRGKELWLHAVTTARGLGSAELTLFSDPNATGFYEAMGARWIREQPTSRPGWNLQVFRYQLNRVTPAQN